MRSFTDLFLEFTQDAESPESFFRWSSLSCVSAILRDNVYVDLGLGRVWPNLYIILMAKSAALRKSSPLNLAKDLIYEVGGTKLVAGRASIQAVVQELGRQETDRQTGRVLQGASGIIISNELASFAPDDPATIPLLTDLYDNHKEWTNSLVSSGKTILKNTCVSLLAATNETLFKTVYTANAIRGGLLGRTFIVRETKKKNTNSLMFLDHPDQEELRSFLEKKYDRKPLVERLREVGKLRGAAQMDFNARAEFDSWYTGFDHLNSSNSSTGDTGVSERVHWGVLKVALAICVSNTNELVIRKWHIEESIERCVGLLKNYEVLAMNTGKGVNAEPGAILLTFLFEHGGKSSHKEVLRHNWMHFDAEQLKVIVTTLSQAGLIAEVVEDLQPMYYLTQKGKEIFK